MFVRQNRRFAGKMEGQTVDLRLPTQPRTTKPASVKRMERILSLRRITGKKDMFECSACHERFERKPDASASRDFAAHVKSKHQPKSGDVNRQLSAQAALSAG